MSAESLRSTIFCDSDADITFKSSNGVLFCIHRKNLETSTGGFAPGEFSANGEEEVVSLSEDFETLELLFQFVYPRRHPSLLKTPFPLLDSLAEAAKKYQVFAAITICNVRMEYELALLLHPVEVLNYAAKHGYPGLVEAAVPRLLDLPLEIVVQALSDNLVVPWVRSPSSQFFFTPNDRGAIWQIIFRQKWSNAVLDFVWTPIEGTHFVTSDKRKSCKFGCVHGDGLIAEMWKELGEKRSIEGVMDAYASLRPPCTHITIDTAEIRARLVAELSGIPAFMP
ncbi:hypothetical protein C0995_011229 [Termitomyces sp. Mi166|nr:hypothetical protein C0995_011229 [Termitomyces sp. Mi166\